MNSSTIHRVALVLSLLVLLTALQGCSQAPRVTPAPLSPIPTPPPSPVPTGAPTVQTVAPAPSAAGHWEGSVVVAGQTLTARVDLEADGDALKGTVDFPQQNALDLPLQQASQQGNKVRFEVLPAPNTAVFDGQMVGADQIEGTFSQAGFTGSFTLTRKEAEALEVVPYREEEITFSNGDVTLAGTLTLPPGAGPYPAVVLVSGSGAQNRDEEVFGFKIFRMLADALTRKGIAVLRYDDRGVGGSSAGADSDTSDTYAGDVAAAVQYLRGRHEIAPQSIGLLGHSEGGIIAPLVATRSPDVAFIILMSGTGVPGSRILQEQARLINEASGLSPADVEEKADLQKRVINAALAGQGWDPVRTDLVAEFEKTAAAMPEDQRKALGDVDTWVARSVDSQIAALQSPWMQFFLSHDPAPVLEKVAVPVLALFGGLDLQVPAEENRDAIVSALQRGGNKDVTVELFPDANHLFQKAVTGSPTEYATLKPEFVPGFLETISDWILAHAK